MRPTKGLRQGWMGASIGLAFLTSSLSASPFQSDFTSDGIVGLDDFVLFAGAFGSTTGSDRYSSLYDLDTDGAIGFGDFGEFAREFGQSIDCGNDPGNGSEIIDGPEFSTGPDHENPFRSLTVHPTDSFTILIGTERNGFVRSVDGGETWTRHREGLRHLNQGYPEVWDIAYDLDNPDVVYAATLDSPGPITGDFPSSIAGVYRSENGGDTWQRANCGLESSRITSIAAGKGVVIAGLEAGSASFSSLQGRFFDGGLYQSVNGGRCWTRITIPSEPAETGFWKIWGPNPEGIFLTYGLWLADASFSTGFHSNASGAWAPLGDPLASRPITNFDVSSDGQTLYASQRDFFRLLISTDGGATWTETETNQAGGPVAISPADTQTLLFASHSALYRSTNGAQTSSIVLEASLTDVVYAPSSADTAFATGEGYDVYRSVDGGATFELIVNLRTDVLNP